MEMKCFINVFIDNLKIETLIKRFRNVSFTTVKMLLFEQCCVLRFYWLCKIKNTMLDSFLANKMNEIPFQSIWLALVGHSDVKRGSNVDIYVQFSKGLVQSRCFKALLKDN